VLLLLLLVPILLSGCDFVMPGAAFVTCNEPLLGFKDVAALPDINLNPKGRGEARKEVTGTGHELKSDL
jgi:hypothetical protein